MTKTDLCGSCFITSLGTRSPGSILVWQLYIRMAPATCAAARAAAHADPAVYTRTLAPTRSGFRHNVSKNYPQDLKMVQKVAPCDSLQSPLKITC